MIRHYAHYAVLHLQGDSLFTRQQIRNHFISQRVNHYHLIHYTQLHCYHSDNKQISKAKTGELQVVSDVVNMLPLLSHYQ